MSTKTVYQLDPLGYFVGEASARESPLEPGVWHLPAGTIEVKPPSVADGQRARWIGGDWLIVPPEAEPPPEPPTEQELRDRARLRRAQAEAAGVAVDGITYASDLESQARMAAASAYLVASGEDAVTWKSWNGYVELSLEMLRKAAVAVGAHVQSCFAAEAAVLSGIAHGDIMTFAEVDAAPAWPDNGEDA